MPSPWKLLLLLTAVTHIRGQGTAPVLSSPAGTFRGTTEWSPQGQPFLAFLGIPYAKPPVGELRFSRPEPIPRIQGVFDADKRGPVCIQPQGIDLGHPSDEDCLYLNIYLPYQKDVSTKTLKKVFFYIHGGGGFMGSADEQIPGELVTSKEIIVVTFNYRLAWLGFLKGDSPWLPGNQGLWDQLMALRWVKDNIGYFGGDPDDVTVGGQSFGSQCVSVLSITRQAKGLFTKGLLMSGSRFTHMFAHNDSHTLLNHLSSRLGCQHDNLTLTVQCLRSLPATSFVFPIETRLRRLFISEDGELLPSAISAIIEDARYLKDVGFNSRDYLVTLTNAEGPILLQGVFALFYDFQAFTSHDLTNMTHWPLAVSEEVIAWYRDLRSNHFLPAFNILGDLFFALPTFNFLQVYNQGNRDGDRGSYFMLLDHMPSYMPRPHIGFYHALDLSYMFDLDSSEILRLYYRLDTVADTAEEEIELRRVYQTIVGDFILSGNPGLSLNQNLTPTWLPYDLEHEYYLNFNQHASVRQFPLDDRRTFWIKTFPSIKETPQGQSLLKDEL